MILITIVIGFSLSLSGCIDFLTSKPTVTTTKIVTTTTEISKDTTTVPIGVVIENISPPSGFLGAEVTIRGFGFTPTNNDIAFNHKDINFQGRNTAYLNGIPSADGKTLRFNIPDNANVLLSACALSQIKENEACPDIGINLPSGKVRIFVVNKNGISNSVSFTVISRATTTTQSSQTTEIQEIQKVIKTWHDSIVKGDWETVFNNMVDINGKPYSKECRAKFKEAFGTWVGAKYTLDIGDEIIECEYDPLIKAIFEDAYGVKLEELPKGCISIPYSSSMSFPDGSSQSGTGAFAVLKVDGKWKVLVACKPLLYFPSIE